jgi:multicomponent Na+:H+ antiporter subunit B
VLLAGLSGVLSLLIQAPFMTSIWLYFPLGETIVPLSTPTFFDIGVYMVVLGTIAAIALGLEDDGEDVA